MSDERLRRSLIRLAYTHPEMRGTLLVFLRTAMEFDTKEELEGYKKTHKVKPTTKLTVKDKDKQEPSAEKEQAAETPKFLDPEEQTAYGKKAEGLRKSWKSSHKEALLLYTGSAYEDINTALRAGYAGPDDDDSFGAVEAMDEFFASPQGRIQHPVTVSRMFDKKHPLAEMILAGKNLEGFTYKDKGFISTSISPPEDRAEFSMVLSVPKGAKAAYLGPPPWSYSTYPGENELLLDRGSTVRITRVVKVGSNYRILCEMAG